MPGPQADAPPVNPVATQEVDAFENLELSNDVKQILEEEKLVTQEVPAEVKPEVKSGETQPQDDGVDKVFIRGENGEELEAPLEDVIKDALQYDSIKIVDGKAVVDFVADGKTYQNVDIPKLIRYSQLGVNANNIIQKANRSISMAEQAIADQKQAVEYAAEQLATNKVARIIDSLSRGIDPITNQPLTEDMREGAKLTSDQLQRFQMQQRLDQLEKELKGTTTSLSQRQLAEKSRMLESEAQAKMATVFQPFTQYFKADGKPLDGLFARFKEAVNLEVVKRANEYRKEIGVDPDIPTDWVRDTAKEVAKAIFKDYQPLLNKPVLKPAPRPTKAVIGTGKAPVLAGKKKNLSWDEEREQIERDLGYKK